MQKSEGMSHYSPIRTLSTIVTVARYIYSDISACTIETMIGKWSVPIKIVFFFLSEK